MSIPASQLVNVIPGVLGTGGDALELNGLLVSQSTTIPAGGVTQWSSAQSVSDYFGSTSVEATLATIYFNGFDNSDTKPKLMFIGAFVGADVAGWLRGGSVTGTIADFQAITAGTLTLTIDGTEEALTGIDLASETSFSAMAAEIQTVLRTETSATETVTYESDFQAFLITSATTGASSEVSFADTSELASLMKLTEVDGAVVSSGLAERTIAENMTAFTQITQNWVTFMHVFDQTNNEKVEFATWANDQNSGLRYVYSTWDSSITATDPNSTSNLAYLINEANLGGTSLNYNTKEIAAFVLAFGASLSFTTAEGRATIAYKGQSGLAVTVNTLDAASGLIANGYNFYGDYANANNRFFLYQEGTITGTRVYLDTHLNAIHLNDALQTAGLTLLATANSIPYNDPGYNRVRSAMTDPIAAALNFGSIRAGVPLSTAQAASIDTDAGVASGVASGVVVSTGFFLQILDATAQTRGNRESPPIKFYYSDGGSIQKLEIGSTVIR